MENGVVKTSRTKEREDRIAHVLLCAGPYFAIGRSIRSIFQLIRDRTRRTQQRAPRRRRRQ